MADTDDRNDAVAASDEADRKKDKKSQKKKKKKKQKKKKAADKEAEKPTETLETKDTGDIKPKDKEADESSATNKIEAATTDSDDDDNDEEDLLAAAALWAGNDDETEETQKTAGRTVPPRQKYSLHITQLPYDSTVFDLRKLFAEHGCSITSIRLVYDQDTEGRKTVFRGVAFIDLLDERSYETALKLHHNTSIRGRRLNVRPCRSKEELAEIVARTQELVQEKIRQNRSGEVGEKGTTNKERGASSPNPKRNENNGKRKNDKQKDRKNNKKPRVDKDGKPIKLTKKERNRRAAIIMQKRRRQKK
ncbi:unnamed protein product [Pseudo-nitzschia multistriata]|uniref:RRM domain-containing protein n=1 Tax=Pseudo-nitzschia multistriata TaxID=183589 RepID=A0A448YXL1_9STRA|nr:unnamed protein product [Pseudo-nitzschia multistriata]